MNYVMFLLSICYVKHNVILLICITSNVLYPEDFNCIIIALCFINIRLYITRVFIQADSILTIYYNNASTSSIFYINTDITILNSISIFYSKIN